jgi:predicted HAD superfamily Cof-like phosphohydrolase
MILDNWIEMLKEFETTFNGTAVTPITNELLGLRFNLHDEENAEVAEALAFLSEKVDQDKLLREIQDPAPFLSNLTKEIADNIYVLIGTAVNLDLPLAEAFAEVHRSNMSKVGEDGKPIYREDGKVLKGPNYTPANIDQFFPSLTNE